MDQASFEQIVSAYYEPLYRFAYSLAQQEAEACDLTQQTFYLLAAKGHQLRDRSKVKSWLFTTLHREFLGARRRQNRFPHHEVSLVSHELPGIQPQMVQQLDGATAIAALMEVDEIYRAPLTLFYQEDHTYQEIARILNIPAGTVMSRLARGKAQLKKILAGKVEAAPKTILPMPGFKQYHGQS